MEKMDKMDNQEMISALADGQLRGEDFARGVQAAADARARQAWVSYHVIGEVLRTGRACVGTAPEAFLSRLQQRLREESMSSAPALAALQPVASAQRPAANDWRWKLVAGVASVAAVSAVGWNMWSGTAAGSGQPQLAVAPASAAVPVAADATTMMRDPRLDRLLQAHRQLGGGTALGTTSGFLRNATFEGQAR